MSEITLKTRIQNKYKTLDEWNEILEGELTPLKGEVFYAIQENILYQKIGDGMTDFTKLNWLELQHPQSDWGENDSNKNSYIDNRTHYRELISLTWDGNEEGYEVYGDEITEETQNNFTRYIRISDTVPFSLEELSIFGVCKYNYYTPSNPTTPQRSFTSDNISNLLSDNNASITYFPGRFEEKESNSYTTYTAEAIGIYFTDEIPGRTNLKVLFVLSEGTVDIKQTNLPVGIYFIHTTPGGAVLGTIKTSEYSFYCLHKLEKDLINRNLVSYSSNFGHPSNQILFSHSTAEGKENYIGPYTTTYATIYSAFDKNIPFIDLESHTTVNTSSHVEGEKNQIFEKFCHAEGYNNQLSIKSSHIEGYGNSAGKATDSSSVGQGSHIEGYGNYLADAYGGHVEGYSCKGDGQGVHAEGCNTQAIGEGAHAQNSQTIASERYASASGSQSKATGVAADAGGNSTEANHAASFTRGLGTISGTNYQAVVGKYNEIFDDSLFDVGNGTYTNRKTAFSVKADGSARLQLQGDTNDSVVRKDYVDTVTKAAQDEVIKNLLNITNAIDSWESVQKIVREGYAPLIFKIGDQLVCNHSEFGELTWDIIGFDQDIPTDTQYTHSLTLQLHNILDSQERVFDCREAFYCAEEDLNSGTYYLSYNNKIDGTGTTTYHYFTIPEGTTIPQGSLLYNAASGAIFNFIPDCYSADQNLCEVTIRNSTSVPANAIYLGESNYHSSWQSTAGSSNYPQSSIRMFLNGDQQTINWQPQHKNDMPPSYVNNPGFLYGLDPDFKNVLGQVNKQVYNLQTSTLDTISDLVFLPSSTEVFGSNSISASGELIIDGPTYTYYAQNSSLETPGNSADENRKKYTSDGTATAYYLRSTYATNATQAAQSTLLLRIASISTTGSLTQIPVGGTGTSARYLAPCCCIV